MDSKDTIVISGIAGRFPECNNMEEFIDELLKGTDLVTVDSRRYPPGTLDTPERLGKIPVIDKFDAAFFGIHPKQAEFMDPRQRISMETIYECIVDAGYNPQELRGTRTGVYAGLNSFSNNEQLREKQTDGYANIGLCLALAANRASYCFDFKGPSYTLDTACSSGVYAFTNAFNDMRRGIIDSALVCVSHLVLHPHETSEFNKLNMLAADGKCKVFSSVRDGYVRSESCVSILLQKGEQSRRVYATVLGAKNNSDGYKKEGITYPCSVMQLELMDDVCKEAKVNPKEVSYVEAHGTGTPAGDIQECQSIVKMFCQDRKDVLPIGAVKSNMGHSETASGLCSISKVLLAMECGVIPANLHYEPMDMELPGIKENKLKVVTENLSWNGGIVALNSFGFGGANSHILLKSNPKEKPKLYQKPKHRLVQVSGRTEESVNYFLDGIEKNQDDEEFLTLVDEIHKINVEGHNFRGYTILGDIPKREVGRCTPNRPIWFVYTGMGSQWAGVGCDLMKIDIFRNTIKRCAAALKPYDVDLVDIITNTSPTIFDTITNCFVAITAIEIALTDVLYSLGIIPDGFVGHSLGEVGCAYADGQLTAEEAVLIGFARGYATERVKLPTGQMAAVGLSKEECQKLLPENVFIACQNGKNSVTITGLAEPVSEFVEKLSSQGIFARKVNSTGRAYHSIYIKDAAPVMFEFIKDVLKNPKLRSSKWVSSSVPLEKQHETWAQYNGAEYHTNNFCSPVLFDQACQKIPSNAIVVEVAPHGLMQAILKRELGPDVSNIFLVNRSSDDNEHFLLSNIGKIYVAGGQPNLRRIYNNVTLPVSRGTKMIAPLVKWDHNVSWLVPYWTNKDSFGEKITINLSDEKYSYLEGHNIDGRVLMPATGYLELVWQVFAGMNLKDIAEMPVVIENIKFKRATVLPSKEDVTFLVNIMTHSGYFEVFEGGSVVVTGKISTPKNISAEFINPDPQIIPNDNYTKLTKQDIYKECHLRRYMYQGVFQGITACDAYGLQGKIEWNGKFTSFLDTMFHLSLIQDTSRDLMLPTSLEQVIIDPKEHLKLTEQYKELPIFYNQYLSILKSGGVEIVGLDSSKAPRRQHIQEDPILESYRFVPYDSSEVNYDLNTSLQVALYIILENARGLIKTPKICDGSEKDEQDISNKIKQILNDQAMTSSEVIKYNPNSKKASYDALVFTEKTENGLNLETAVQNLSEEGFILYIGNISNIDKFNLQIVYQASQSNNSVYLFRPRRPMPKNYRVVRTSNNNFNWLMQIKELIKNKEVDVIYLYSQFDEISGITGLVKCLLTEPSDTKIRSILVEDKNAKIFSVEDELYRDQLSKNLAYNVLRNGQWGTFVHLPLKKLENRDSEHAAITIMTPGDLSSLKWEERSPNYFRLFSDAELVYVFYSTLNFKDVMVATGKLQSKDKSFPETVIGFEYSGITRNGKRVMGMTFESLSLQVQTDPLFTWEVPDSWSLEDAATIPCVYATCYYAMIIRGQMRPGESILIHAGTGGIGLAAISIALSMNCTVFTTVGSKEKRDFLKNIYPQLKDENIGNSRNKSFRNMIMLNTKARGVDLVLNSLAADLFQSSLKCIATRGRFLEIGKVDFFNESPINSKIFLKNSTFHGIVLDEFFDNTSEIKKEINEMITNGIRSGVVKPLPRTVFKDTEVEEAFRYLSTGKHKGKVLVQIRKEEPSIVKSPKRIINVLPKQFLDPNKSYVLIGGLGGFGLELTDWLIKKGATKLILNSRRNNLNGYQTYCLKKWAQLRHNTVVINFEDTSTFEGANRLIEEAQKLGPVGGVFNMAVALKDALIENQTKEMYEDVFKAKIISGQNMDVITRKCCPDLDHFVVFSSVACGRGNLGQTNYGMANSALERLCEQRRKKNLPGLAVQWGPIGDVGVLIKAGVQDKVYDQMIPQNIGSCLRTLETFMLQSTNGSSVVSSIVLVNKNQKASTGSLKTPAEAIAHVLGIKNLDLIDKSSNLSQLGLDSLMVAEIKQTLYRNYQIELEIEDIRNMTFNKLEEMTQTDSEASSTVTNLTNGLDTTENVPISPIITKEILVELHREDVNQTIFLLHPLEGQIEVLRRLARQLKGVVYGLQCSKDVDFDNIEDHASCFIKEIKKKQPTGPYFLCGYSFGGILALEMGLQLEKDGEKVTIVSIDGSPNYLKSTLQQIFSRMNQSTDKGKTALLLQFSSFLVNQNKVKELLQNCEGWDKQLEIVGDFISKETNLDSKDIVISVDRYYKRCRAGFYYEPKNLLKGKLLLIRREDNASQSNDYDLQKLCQQEIEILKLKGNHRTILEGDNTTTISAKINEMLNINDPGIKEI